MASNQTFQKRQKEMARKERQRAKAERKQQRKLEKLSPSPQAEESDPMEPSSEVAGELVSSDDSQA